MNDLLIDQKAWVIGLLTILGAYMVWSFKREMARIDEALKDSVRRAEFEQLRGDLRREHLENSGRLERIENGVTGTHKRIDDLYSDILDRIK